MQSVNKVIIVEDDKDINNLIAYSLRKENFCVEQVFDGLSAKQRIKEEAFNIIILDIMLPGIDGFEICKEIKDDFRYALSFTVVISAKCHEEDKLFAHLLGADYYLSKPFSLASLLSAVREIRVNLGKESVVKSK